MKLSWEHFLFFTLLCILAQGFFSMFEMACVSLNRVRLKHYVARKNPRAKWIDALLKRPSRLFGTTLITVNTFLQVGSEFSRRLYESWGFNPDLAPISQVFLVVIFAELAPMFAARRHSEHVAMLYIPVAYFVSRLLLPLIFLIEKLNALIHKLLKLDHAVPLFLSREEIQRAFEENVYEYGNSTSLDHTLTVFFQMKNQKVGQFMHPLKERLLVSSQKKVEELIEGLKHHYSPFIPVYHHEEKNVVAIISLRDLLKAPPNHRVIELGKPPWFITEEASLLSVLKQFRSNNQSVAIVLNNEGDATGMLSLENVVEVLFGKTEELFWEEEGKKFHVERTLSGEMLLRDFNVQFQAKLQGEEDETLSEYLTKILQHHPVKGEIVRTDQFEFTIAKPSLFGAKMVQVKTLNT